MKAIIRSVDEARIALREQGPCLVATPCEAPLLPNLIGPPRVATVPYHQVLAAYAKPTGNPDVDRISLCQGTFGATALRSFGGEWVHGTILTAREHRPLCAGKDSEVMAAQRSPRGLLLACAGTRDDPLSRHRPQGRPLCAPEAR